MELSGLLENHLHLNYAMSTPLEKLDEVITFPAGFTRADKSELMLLSVKYLLPEAALARGPQLLEDL